MSIVITVPKLLEIVYSYYPKNVNTEIIDEYTTTKEYQMRISACQNARSNCDKWFNFKEELTSNVEKLNGRHTDYSALGSNPSYYVRIYIKDWFNKYGISEIAIFISIISPFWTYFYENSSQVREYNFPTDFNIEVGLVDKINFLVQKNFKGYKYLSKEFHQIRVKDISSAHKQAPNLNIFDALFSD